MRCETGGQRMAVGKVSVAGIAIRKQSELLRKKWFHFRFHFPIHSNAY